MKALEKMENPGTNSPSRKLWSEVNSLPNRMPFGKVTEGFFGKPIDNAPLTNVQRAFIKMETGWSSEIIDHIATIAQYNIYKKANLHETVINGRKCLVKEIDMNYVDLKTGMTNRDLLAKGRSPIDAKTGERIELHHMGQDFDSPFAELCEHSEHGNGNDVILHEKGVESWRNDPEKKNQYNNEQRPCHWKERSVEG